MWDIENNTVLTISSILVVLSTLVVIYLKWQFQYWKRKNVPYQEPTIPFGNLGISTITKPFNYTLKSFYNKFRELGVRHAGLYMGIVPAYLPLELDLVKHILTKDFQNWSSRGLYYNQKSDPLSAHLFSLDGTRWRDLRAKLTPTFTSGKMKMMFQTLVDSTSPMMGYIEEKNEEPIDVKNIFARFTTDVIGSCAFGLDCNSFKEPNSEFVRMGNTFLRPSTLRSIYLQFIQAFPNFSKAINLPFIPKHVSDFYTSVSENTVKYREENNTERKDFMQILLELKNKEVSNMEKVTMGEISAQAFIFFIAGYETSSSGLTFACLELSRNMDVQNKLRNEINEVLNKYDGDITYDAIAEMKYLHRVVEESLRMYPPVIMLRRKTTAEYTIPGTDIVLEKNRLVLISTYGIHHDPEYYENPEVFDPDRFTEENIKKRHPYAFLPFGEGPRNCIGMRFAYLEIKVALVTLLRNYSLKLNRATKYPLEFDDHSFPLSSKYPILVDFEKLNY